MAKHEMLVFGVADIVEPVEVKSVGTRNSRVGSTRICWITEQRDGPQSRQFVTLEAWNDECDKLAKLQVGSTVMIRGALKIEAFQSNNETKVKTKVNAYTIAYVGKTQYQYQKDANQKRNDGAPQGSSHDSYPGFRS